MTLKKLLKKREGLIADRLAKVESRAYYTSPQWGGAQSGSGEHSDRTAAAECNALAAFFLHINIDIIISI